MRFVIAGAFVFSSAAVLSLALSTTAIGGKGGGGKGTIVPNATADAFANGPTVDTTSVIVQLKGDPVSTNAATKPLSGKKIDFTATR